MFMFVMFLEVWEVGKRFNVIEIGGLMVRRIDSLLFYNLFIFMKNDINEKLSKCFIYIVLILFGNFKSIVIIFVMYLFLNSYKGYYKNYKFRLLIIFY